MAIRNPILASHLNEFKQRHNVISRNDEIAFEHFVNYYVLSNEMREGSLAVEDVRKDVHTGGSGDLAIDGIAILVNGKIASTEDDVDNYAGSGRGTTDAALHFFQTTTQDRFDTSKVLTFLAGVESFLSSYDDSNGQDFNALVRERQKAYRHLLREKGVTLRAGQPTIKLFYVFPGRWPMPVDAPDWWQVTPWGLTQQARYGA